jgi:hypothetical protein
MSLYLKDISGLSTLWGKRSKVLKIAAYGIAKNEEGNIRSWYEGLKDCDYILLLDTGSTDNTIEIAKSLGIKVVQAWFSPWDETTAKNAALSLIPLEYDYCINLDIDQTISTKNWRQILENSPKCSSYTGNLKSSTGLGPSNVEKNLTFIHTRQNVYWDSYRPQLFYYEGVKDYNFNYKLDIEIIDLPGTQERFDNRESLYIKTFKYHIQKMEVLYNFGMLKGSYINLSLSCFEIENIEDTLKYYLKYINIENNKKDISYNNFLDFVNVSDNVDIPMLFAITLILPDRTFEIYDKILNANINIYFKFFTHLRKLAIYFKLKDINKIIDELEKAKSIFSTSYQNQTQYEYTINNVSEIENNFLNHIELFLNNSPEYNEERMNILCDNIFGNIHYGKYHPELAKNAFDFFIKNGAK